MTTLLEMAKIAAAGGVAELLDEAARPVPEITGQYTLNGKQSQVPRVGDARPIPGTQYKTLIRTGLPAAGFRGANEGVVASKSAYENRLVETMILNPRWECDKAVADACVDGPEAFIAMEAVAVLQAGLMQVGRNFYYGTGTGGDAKGFPGLLQSHDTTNMVVDAAGTTDNVASSVWGVKFGMNDTQFVIGENGQLEVTDVRIESIVDPADSTKRFTAYIQELLSWIGLQVKSPNSIVRIKKLTTDVGKGLTDALLGSALAKFPTGWAPDVWFASRRSLEQLRASRTATNATGQEAPTPTDHQGIPIVPTDSILNTETLAL